MKKAIMLFAVCILLLLCACGNRSDDPQKEVIEDTKAIEPVLENEYSEIQDKLLGTWKNEYWERVLSFVDYETCIFIEVSDSSDNYKVEITNATYELIDEDTMNCISEDGDSETYTFSVSWDELEGYEDFFENDTLTRVNDEGKSGYSVVGDWKLLGVNEEVAVSINARDVVINNLVFYYDGSYTMKSDYPRNGNYEVVHDGNAICLDGKYYWDIEFPCVGVMLLTTGGKTTWVYVRQ